jgi:uncharacterized protein (TIGR03067 family)
MYALLLSAAAMASAAPDDKPVNLDGNWTVLAAEKDGQPMADAKDMTVTIKGDTITCNGKDGKKAMSVRVEFGPKGTVKVTDTTNAAPGDKPESKEGVYIHTRDFLSVCVHKAGDRPEPGAAAAPAGTPDAKYSCVIFLKREGPR